MSEPSTIRLPEGPRPADHSVLPLLPLVLGPIPEGLAAMLAQEGIAAEPHGSLGATGRFVLFDSKHGRCPFLERGQAPLDLRDILAGLPADPFEALSDEGAVPHRWNIGEFTVDEEIARVDRRAIRATVMSRLRQAIEAVGGVWLRLAPFPFPFKSAFNLRIDHDAYDSHDFDRAMTVAESCPQAFSHYLCASGFANAPQALARMRGHDVGSHGFWHHTYRSRADNLANLRRGIEALQSAGLQPSGFVAPHGRYNRALAQVLETLAIPFSSEFGLGYDELPYFPRHSPVLQIPVHPVCLGLFLEAAKRKLGERADTDTLQLALAAGADACADYWQQVARAKYAAGEPVLLYCHPDGRLGRYPQVMTRVLETVNTFAAMWKTTNTEINRWWRSRRAIKLRLYREREFFVLSAEGLPARHRVAVEFWRGNKLARLPVAQSTVVFSQEALVYENWKPCTLAPPEPLIRPLGLGDRFKRHIDWERTTPPRDLRDGSWRGWTKWMLRQVKG